MSGRHRLFLILVGVISALMAPQIGANAHGDHLPATHPETPNVREWGP
jgi:hypothetical protein